MNKPVMGTTAGLVLIGLLIFWARLPRTWYPATYSERNFSRIQIGTSAEEVRRLIGEPSYIPDGHYWQYSRPGGSILPMYRWKARSLVISNGVVVRIIKDDAVL